MGISKTGEGTITPEKIKAEINNKKSIYTLESPQWQSREIIYRLMMEFCGISIKGERGEFKELPEILEELKPIWNNLDEKKQISICKLLYGDWKTLKRIMDGE